VPAPTFKEDCTNQPFIGLLVTYICSSIGLFTAVREFPFRRYLSLTVTIRLYSTLAHFVAPVPAMHSHGAPRRGVLVSLPIAAILTEKGVAWAHDCTI